MVTKPLESSQPRRCWRILIAGTGGQGVVTAAQWLTDFFVAGGHAVTSGRLHGMAQRGGSVQSSVMVDCGASPMIPEGGAHVVLGLEPVEAARSLPFISPETVVFMDTTPVIPFTLDQQRVRSEAGARYPDIQKLVEHLRAVTPRVFAVGATRLAVEAGSVKTLNMVLLGCWLGSPWCPFAPADFLDTVFGDVPAGFSEVNRKAFSSGVEFGKTIDVVKDRP